MKLSNPSTFVTIYSEKFNSLKLFGIIGKGNPMLIDRPRYVDSIMIFARTDLVKVITGIRRCGKSSILELVQQRLIAEGAVPSQVSSINLESRTTPVTTAEELYSYFKQKSETTDGMLYIFIDEVQRIQGWHDVVNAMRIDFDCDIYVTGSNAFLLSSDISTYLSGRYVEINVLPLVLSEYLDFCGVSFDAESDAALCPDGTIRTFDALLERYMQFGGMPAIASLETTQEQQSVYAKSLYDTVINRDIMDRTHFASERRISDPLMLRRVVDYLADNIGNLLSPNSIANALAAEDRSATEKTVRAYVKALQDAFLFYECKRFDLRGKGLLKTNPKLYLSDLGMRRWLLSGRFADVGRVFENAVYLQLLYRKNVVQVGKLYNKEIDFVATEDGAQRFIQVADNVDSEKTFEREMKPLRSIRDSSAKYLIVRNGSFGKMQEEIDGVRILDAQRFFLG